MVGGLTGAYGMSDAITKISDDNSLSPIWLTADTLKR